MGFRDVEHDVSFCNSKKVVFIVGDSFVAGVGIKDYKKRFSDILREKLPQNWELFIIAKPGWDTEHQLKFLQGFQIKPDIVVLAYYINDIKGAAKKEGIYERIVFNVPENRMIRYLLQKSYSVTIPVGNSRRTPIPIVLSPPPHQTPSGGGGFQYIDLSTIIGIRSTVSAILVDTP